MGSNAGAGGGVYTRPFTERPLVGVGWVGWGGQEWPATGTRRTGGPGVGQGLGARLQRRFERPADGGPELGMLGRGGRYMYGVLGGAASGPAHGPPRPARHRQGAWPPF
uniref:Uncharacterized protein n=1 Tax=Human herpesvirus 2 TaxID=10310 RepID=A0A481T5F3_HHV2|nr:hypothetical protein [Human alphaherpesvirus 2]